MVSELLKKQGHSALLFYCHFAITAKLNHFDYDLSDLSPTPIPQKALTENNIFGINLPEYFPRNLSSENPQRESRFKMALRNHFLPALILFTIALAPLASADETKTSINTIYRFTFEYPSGYLLKTFGDGYFDLIGDGKILLRASVEDNTFKIFIKENNPTGDIFHSFARERCKIVCGADGPDGSSYCDEIESETEFVSGNGLRVLEFYLVMTRENYSEKTKKKSRVGPVYLVDMSQANWHLALMIHPGYGALASESNKTSAREIVDSIRLLQ